MRRWIAFCLLILALGLGTTVGVAWIFAGVSHEWQEVYLGRARDRGTWRTANGWTVCTWRGVGDRTRLLTPREPRYPVLPGELDAPPWSAAWSPPPPGSSRVIEDERGWPFPALRVRWHEPAIDLVLPDEPFDGGLAIRPFDLPPRQGPRRMSMAYTQEFRFADERRALPLTPAWPGFIASTLVYTVAWMSAIFLPGGPAWVRRWLRRRRGRCVRCRYPILEGGVRCPECGLAFSAHDPFLRPRRLAMTAALVILVVVAEGTLAVALVRRIERPAPIFVAARHNDVESLRALLDAHTPVESPLASDTPGARGSLPLMWAAAHGNLEAMEFLIDRGARVGLSFNRGATALYLAARCGETDAVRYLIEHSADVTRPVAGGFPLHTASRHGHLETMRVLIEFGADVDARGSTGTALDAAARFAGPESIALLLAAGAQVDDPPLDWDPMGPATPLAHAADVGRLENVVALLEAGATVDPPAGRSPLVLAIREGHEDVSAVLLEAGARVDPGVGHLLWRAAEHDLTDLARRLIERGADVNQERWRVSGWSPLRMAIARDNLQMARLFVAAGASTELRTDAGETLLFAIPWSDASEGLIDFVLDLGIDVNTADSHGNTPLMWAVGDNCLAGVTRLLDAGADPRATNADGLSALDIARVRRRVPPPPYVRDDHPEIVRRLEIAIGER